MQHASATLSKRPYVQRRLQSCSAWHHPDFALVGAALLPCIARSRLTKLMQYLVSRRYRGAGASAHRPVACGCAQWRRPPRYAWSPDPASALPGAAAHCWGAGDDHTRVPCNLRPDTADAERDSRALQGYRRLCAQPRGTQLCAVALATSAAHGIQTLHRPCQVLKHVPGEQKLYLYHKRLPKAMTVI